MKNEIYREIEDPKTVRVQNWLFAVSLFHPSGAHVRNDVRHRNGYVLHTLLPTIGDSLYVAHDFEISKQYLLF